ncbi:MAG: nucleotidyltransferase domain-containing protein [bacterium]|nr:nucleotidyltransferase domain-containing protein [bacterium]
MAVVAPVAAPTRTDAAVAAAVLVDKGVAEVLLFGSVARGVAAADSDIDLVAIFADLDYSERAARRRELEAAARAVVPWPVQVHVTDRPEWRARVEQVSTSFERHASSESVWVAGATSEGPVDWGKEMVLPMSDPQEALRYFDASVLPCLQGVATACIRPAIEDVPHESSVPVEKRRLNRMVKLCADAALAAETSVKTMAKLYSSPTPTDKELKRNGHTIGEVLQRHVPEPHCGEMQAAFERLGVDLEELSSWRSKAAYADDADVVRAEADRFAPSYASMASEITGLVAAHLRRSLGRAAEATVTERDSLAEVIAGHDVRLGLPAPVGLDI